jgi:hypothetical protein
MRLGRALLAVASLLAAAPGAAGAESARDWTQRALALQYELASDVGLRNAPWVYTHNSYNSEAEMGPTLSNRDDNQNISIVDQLNEGVRHLEIDAHLFVSPGNPGLRGPVVCHALPNHGGCTVEKPLSTVLGEVRGWMRANPSQVLLLYIESHLDDADGYAKGARAVERTLGDVLWRPPGGGSRCAAMPLSLTRDQVRRAGKRVLIIGPCGVGREWPALVFDESPRRTGHDNRALRPFPDCGPDFKRSQYQSNPIRYYEDSTSLSNTGDPITAPIATRMVRCGVDIIGFDQLDRGDSRLEAIVWSWARGQPRGGSCAAQRPDGRWEARPCFERRRAACLNRSGAWRVSARAGRARSAPRLCASRRLRNGVPRTGYEGQLLRVAQARARAGRVWLGLRRDGSAWRRSERRGCGPGLRQPKRRWRVRRGVARFVVRLGFRCTGERLRRRLVIRGGKRVVRARTGRRIRVRVGRRTRRLKVRYRYDGRRRTAIVLLRRR